MKILLATDGSEYSESAAKFLTCFDLSPKDEIIVLYVVSEIPYEDDHHSRIKIFIKKLASKILDSSVNILKPVQAKIRSLEEEGYPDTTIIDMAVNSDVDLIVTGARGVKGVQTLFLGSVTRAVAINSPIPVLVVKKPQRETSGDIKVLFATDGSDTAGATAGFLSSMPFPHDTEVMVMTVSWSAFSDIPDRFALEIDDKIKEDITKAKAIEYAAAEKALKQAGTVLNKRFINIKELIKIGDPSVEILKASEEFSADIVAVGSRGLRGVKRMIGSVSRRILTHSPCSVLLGKFGEK